MSQLTITRMDENRHRDAQKLLSDMDAHVTALLEGARDVLARGADDDVAPMRSVEIVLRVDLDDNGHEHRDHRHDPAAAEADSECWTARYICGKGPTGYLWCTVDVCMEVGPVTVLPG